MAGEAFCQQQLLCLGASPLRARKFHHNAPLAAMLMRETYRPHNIAMPNVARPADKLIETTGASQSCHKAVLIPGSIQRMNSGKVKLVP